MKTSRLDCLVAGDANADLLIDGIAKLEFDKEKLATDMNLVLGGSSSIFAFNLARLGAKVGFAGVVGDDFFGTFVTERLRWAGVDAHALRRLRRTKTGLTIWCNQGGRRAGITYNGTIAMVRARDVDRELRRARHLHVGAYFLLEKLHPGAAALFRRAKKIGLTTSLDCNYDPAETWDSGIRQVLKFTDIFFPERNRGTPADQKPQRRACGHGAGEAVSHRGRQAGRSRCPGMHRRKAVSCPGGKSAGCGYNRGRGQLRRGIPGLLVQGRFHRSVSASRCRRGSPCGERCRRHGRIRIARFMEPISTSWLQDLIRRNRRNEPVGVCSVCSANPWVIEAAMCQAIEDQSPVCIESTCNQVNQFGGYTGLTPAQFAAFVRSIASRVGFPEQRILFGGDHLGPYPWRSEPSQAALDKAAGLVRASVLAGYTKIHLDASMACADDSQPIEDEVIAERAAALCQVAEKELPASSPAPLYIIGTEVPTPEEKRARACLQR